MLFILKLSFFEILAGVKASTESLSADEALSTRNFLVMDNTLT